MTDAAACYLNGRPNGQWRWDLHGATLQPCTDAAGKLHGSGYASNYVRYHEFVLYPLGDEKPRVPPIGARGDEVPPPSGEKQKRAAKIELLKDLDLGKLEKHGTWVLDKGMLACQADGGGSGHLVLPVQPPEEYDLEVTFARVNGGGDLILHLPIRGHNAVLGFDVFGGAGSALGLGYGTREEGAWLAREGSIIGSGRRKIGVSVRNDRFQVFVDGRPFYDLPGEVKCVTGFGHGGDTLRLQTGSATTYQFESVVLTPYGEVRKK
jgi:hypothetical protein